MQRNAVNSALIRERDYQICFCEQSNLPLDLRLKQPKNVTQATQKA